MTDIVLRSVPADMEIRSDGRTVAGIVVPYGQRTPIREWGVSYEESFARGAFPDAVAAPGKVKFLGMHDRMSFPLGAAQSFRDDAAGLYGEFRVSKTTRGDDVLELVRDGALDGFSVGFRSIVPDHAARIVSGSHVVRQKAHLAEVSAVTFPAYDGARISEIRSADVELVRAFVERAGKTHSAATVAQLQKVLDLIASADDSVDEALVELSSLMGVDNPDSDTPEDTEPSGSDEGRGRASLELAERIARLAAIPATT